MAIEDHPLYLKWRAALEHLIEAKGRLEMAQTNDEVRMCLNDYNRALYEYSKIANEI